MTDHTEHDAAEAPPSAENTDTQPEAAEAESPAQPTADGYRLDIRLQGDAETVFFAV